MKMRIVFACLAVCGLLIGCAANTDSEPTQDQDQTANTSEAARVAPAAGGGNAPAPGPFNTFNCFCPNVPSHRGNFCGLPVPPEVCAPFGAVGF
jgi:hypothetical protein